MEILLESEDSNELLACYHNYLQVRKDIIECLFLRKLFRDECIELSDAGHDYAIEYVNNQLNTIDEFLEVLVTYILQVSETQEIEETVLEIETQYEVDEEELIESIQADIVEDDDEKLIEEYEKNHLAELDELLVQALNTVIQKIGSTNLIPFVDKKVETFENFDFYHVVRYLFQLYSLQEYSVYPYQLNMWQLETLMLRIEDMDKIQFHRFVLKNIDNLKTWIIGKEDATPKATIHVMDYSKRTKGVYKIPYTKETTVKDLLERINENLEPRAKIDNRNITLNKKVYKLLQSNPDVIITFDVSN
jgi:hypothetical protein